MGRIEILRNGEIRIEVADGKPFCNVFYFVGNREVTREDFDSINRAVTAAALIATARKT